MTKRLFLWSGPRNISTTLMYSFAQRADCVVYDEPLYGAYLEHTSAKKYHPSAQAILDDMECDPLKVVSIMVGVQPKKVAFFKNMTHHLMDLDKAFLKNGFNILLTRNPREMLPSFDKIIPNPSLHDVGYAAHIKLLEYFEQEAIPYAVLEARKVLENPEGVLKKLCQAADIPFDAAMLRWPAGARPEDGIWAAHWYKSVHASTGFKPYEANEEAFPKHLNKLLGECQKLYAQLSDKALNS